MHNRYYFQQDWFSETGAKNRQSYASENGRVLIILVRQRVPAELGDVEAAGYPGEGWKRLQILA